MQNEKNKLLKMENTLLIENILRQYEKCCTMNDLKLFDGERNFYLSEILDENCKLVVWFSDQQCSSCIDFVIEELVKSYEKILEGKLIVIGSFRNKRSYMEFVKNKQMPFCVYGEMESLFDMNIEEEIPSMFLLNKNMEMRNVFYPMKEIPFMVNQYFKIINKQLKSE